MSSHFALGPVPDDVKLRLKDQADEASLRGDVRGQLDPVRQMLSIAQQEGLVDSEIRLLRWLGNITHTLGNLRYAHAYRLAASDLVDQYAGQISVELRVDVEIDIGRSYFEVRDWEQAETHTRRALAEVGGFREPEDRSRRFRECLIDNHLAIICAKTGRASSQQALEMLQQALETAEALDDAYLLCMTYFNLAVQYREQYRLITSQTYAQKAVHYAEISRDSLQRANAQFLASEISVGLQILRGTIENPRASAEHLERGLRLARNLGNPLIVASAQVNLALLNEQSDNVTEAESYFQAALESLEQVRVDLGYEQFQLSFFDSFQRHYQQATLCRLRNQRAESAFETLEQLRSRLLLATLGPGRWDLSEWTDEERVVLREVLGRYGGLALQATPEQAYGENDGNFGSSVPVRSGDTPDPEDSALQQARQDFLNLYNGQRANRIDWLGRQSPPTASLAESRHLLGAQDALISYMCTDDSLVMFCLTREDFHFQQLNLSVSELREEVARLHQDMGKLQEEALDPFTQWFDRTPEAPWPRSIRSRSEAVLRRLDRFFALLIAPVLPAIADRPHWIIVPNGPLHRVPWAALHSREGYLVEAHTLSLLPSASVGLALAKATPGDSSRVITLGDPDPDHPSLQLPASRQEVEALQRAFPDSSRPFLGDEANRTNFLRWAPSAQLLHVACHHFFDSSAPLLSFLKLSGEQRDQFIFAFEVAELELQARLVTLSACESGLSRGAAGDEQFGIVRSFLAAGAQSVISTLWPIQDQSASVFFGDFYQRACRVPLGLALAEAQRRMLASPAFQLPCFWAPYALTGKWGDRLRVARADVDRATIQLI